ncbi:MAG: tetratricopeptide repeat protein [Phycisphaerae bacterium]|nr:tetratricopeptide repeat protein [Phycisphaerae bacterium]
MGETFDKARHLIAANRLDEARAILLRAVAGQSPDPDLANLLSVVLSRQGDNVRALYFARLSCRAAPDHPLLLNNLGNQELASGDLRAAAESYGRAVALDPDLISARVGLTNALLASFDLDECARVAREGLARAPGEHRLTGQLAVCLLLAGRARDAVDLLREARRAAPDDPGVASALAAACTYAGGIDDRDILEAHAAYGRLLERLDPGPYRPPPASPLGARPLRLGLLSGDLRAHAVGFFVEPLLLHRDPARLWIACYSVAAIEDDVSRRFRGLADLWRAVSHEPIDRLERTIRADRLDVLLDLSGHTSGHRLPVLHRRPAPITATYFGYPNTTGLRACDVRLVDSHTDPPGSDHLATERLVRLDPCFLCYRPPAPAPPVASPPCLGSGRVTFGSFNAIAKLDDLTIDLLARTLATVPGSRLLLKAHALRNQGVRADVRERLERAGIAPDAIALEGPGEGAAEMLAHYARMDVMLDSFPYHGTTTTCEALFMGVPVITLAGSSCRARVGLSILRNAGLGDLVADTPEAFARLAADLVADQPRLAGLRGSLRDRLLASPACDGPGFASRFTDALRTLVPPSATP